MENTMPVELNEVTVIEELEEKIVPQSTAAILE